MKVKMLFLKNVNLIFRNTRKCRNPSPLNPPKGELKDNIIMSQRNNITTKLTSSPPLGDLGGWKPWISAFRLKTLPLALSNTLVGSALAVMDGGFRWSVFVLAALTTVLLQILSNMANDYGDFVNGKDTAERVGPKRMVQSGEISAPALVFIFAENKTFVFIVQK
jgi:hypothetical protein